MSEPPRHKPLPARHMAPAPSGVREAPVGAPPPGAHSALPDRSVVTVESPAAPALLETPVEGRGGTWTARVLGRAGRSSARSAPLMLLGFTKEGAPDTPSVTLEATVPGRSLAELSREALETALKRASEPPSTTRKRPFFEDADRGRGA